MQAAQNGLDHLHQIIAGWGKAGAGCPDYEKRFAEAINDDLDTPKALAIMWELIKDPIYPDTSKKRALLKFDTVLGLGLRAIRKHTAKIPAAVEKLIAKRTAARAEKNWKESDVLRAQIETLGYTIKDTANGTEITKQ